jgi:ATP-dependent Clp protease protease subunit
VKSWNIAVRATGSDDLEIAVYDVIGDSFFGEGITAKDVLGKLRGSPNAKRISLRVNSVGGILDEAKAMVNLLNERAANGVEIVATVDGIAASAASYLLTAASKVTMPANAFLMVHAVRTGVRGTASDMEKAGALMRRMDDQLAEAYSAASLKRGVAKSKDEYLASFDKGDLYLNADEAIAFGLCDEKVAALKVAACLADLAEFDSAPEALKSAPYISRALAIASPVVAQPIAALDVAPAPQGSKTMTKDELKAKHPELFAELLEEGRATAVAEREPAIVDPALAKLSATALSLTGSKTVADAEVAIVALAAKNDKLERLETEVAVLGKERHHARVSQLIAEGKLKPSRKEYFMNASAADLDQYLVATGGEVLAPIGQEHSQPQVVQPVNGKGTITAEDRNVGKLLNLSEEQMQQAADLRAQRFGK